MTNAMNYNNKSTQAAAVAVMNDVLSSHFEGTMDDIYETISQYVSFSRQKFNELYEQASAKVASWKKAAAKPTELNDEDLDAVVGGGSTWDWICDHKKELAIIAGITLLCAVGAGAAGASIYLAFEAASLTAGAVGGATLGAAFGMAITCDAMFGNHEGQNQ